MDRRNFLIAAAALGAEPLWAGTLSPILVPRRKERRDLFPEGVASGDPDHRSVILWTRRPFPAGERRELSVEIALDPEFRSVISRSVVPVLRNADWTCRVLAAGLKPATVYWYRFMDEDGWSSRVGRTNTAPTPQDDRPARFAFVSCQAVNVGAQNAYRRMIWDDARKAPAERLGFVLHLGDFIYEVVQYPEDGPHRLGRTVFDIGRVPDARKVGSYHVPTGLDGYRMVYRAHLADPDVQDARAQFPFVCIGDNHEFSWQGFQSFVQFGDKVEPAQRLRVAANQAWWEFIPSRVRKASGHDLGEFRPPVVEDAPAMQFDGDGLVAERNSLAAIHSMTAYRTFRWGRHLDLIITDLHSYAMQDPTTDEAATLDLKRFPLLCPQEAVEVLDAGRAYPGGAPDTIRVGEVSFANFRKDQPPYSVLGRDQKAWLKSELRRSGATWKVWAATNATLDMRADPKNLPDGMGAEWPGDGFATFGGGDFSAAFHERAELYDFVRDSGITNFVTVSGDRHSFWAGYSAKALPPAAFEPVGAAFVVGSISAPGMAEATEHGLKGHPLRPLFVTDRGRGPETTMNLLLKHGVRSALEYSRSGDLPKAHAQSNPEVAPHVQFVDMGGHGFAIVTAAASGIETEFVCIPRPIARSPDGDGGPTRYRVSHTLKTWGVGEGPKMTTRVLEGDPGLSM